MRITRDTLLKIAKDTAAQRIRVTRRVLCIYLTGSCLSEEPLLGGSGDIDLVMIQDSEPLIPREVIRLSEEVSLDIRHYAQESFLQPRHLRVEPWLGPILYNKPMVLHDPNHWFDYTMASTGSQFLQPDNVLARARSLAESARQTWMDLGMGPSTDPLRRVYAYTKAIENAGNAFASLSGVPLTERRFMLNIPQRAAQLQQPDLSSGLLHLAGGTADFNAASWPGWLAQWEVALSAAGGQENIPSRLLPARRSYYTHAAAALWNDHPLAALWIMIRTWSQSAAHLPLDSEHRAALVPVLHALGLDEAGLEKRLDEMDTYLDRVEETLDRWGKKNGANADQQA